MDESPFKVWLINLVPLGDRGVVGVGRNVKVFVTVGETDVPEIVSGRFESDLEISLVAMGGLIPCGDSRSIVIVGSKLMDNVSGVGCRGQVEVSRVVRARLNVPFEIGLIYPSPSGNCGVVIRYASKNM
jgi:hypothetical protein